MQPKKSFRCRYCDAPTSDEDGNHGYFFFHGVLSENIPDKNGKYLVKAYSGGINPGEEKLVPMSFCTIECFGAWIINRSRTAKIDYPKKHPIA